MGEMCFCGKKESYSTCCGAIHLGKRIAKTAEELMRSRYSAFVLANVDYILATYSAETRPVDQKKEILEWAQFVEWLGLKILNTEKGGESDSKGWVEFQASFKEAGMPQIMHEKSLFQKEKGAWVYVSGEYSSLFPDISI